MNALGDTRALTRALRQLVGALVDYAGLFPPAALDMRRSVANYAAYLEGPHAWMLGKFILPLARTEEFIAAARETPIALFRFPLSIIATDDDLRDPARMNRFAELRAAHDLNISAVETKAETPATVTRLAERFAGLFPGAPVFVEIPAVPSVSDSLVQELRNSGCCAKIRTGGVTREAFPPATAIAAFLEKCAEHGVAMKATAGLHHPVRAVYNLTYETGCDQALMHGFLNVFLAAAFIENGLPRDTAVKLLEDEDPTNFKFSDAGAEWHCQSLTTGQIARARTDFCISYGSCSFEEPVQDLKTLGLL